MRNTLVASDTYHFSFQKKCTTSDFPLQLLFLVLSQTRNQVKSMPPLLILDDDNDAERKRTDEMTISNIDFTVVGVSRTSEKCSSDLSERRSPLNASEESQKSKSFTALRVNYLLVTMVIMLADGLQGTYGIISMYDILSQSANLYISIQMMLLYSPIGTHLYVLYDGYGFSVASLYSLGFLAGAITTPITGPLIDKFGRKRSALLYCILEIGINMLEQYPFLMGLIVSRVVGGVTTNLLSSVFETWLDTEYRRRGLDAEKYEIILRDSVVVSNISAIASGYLAHILAERYGAVGPFRGAVTCTALALVVVFALWTENFGGVSTEIDANDDYEKRDGASCVKEPQQYQSKKGLQEFMNDAVAVCRADSRVLRVGIIQGLTTGSLQTFVFLWSPTLQVFAKHAPKTVSFGLDGAREPAYGLIFGAFMAAGVVGGFLSPVFRKLASFLVSPSKRDAGPVHGTQESAEGVARPMAVEIQAAACYLLSAGLLFVPCMVSETGDFSFSISLVALLFYELIIGVMMPCEGVIRSLYLPSDARATMLTLPRIIVNLAVACGVIITRGIT
jgi:MFS family permease